MRSSLNNGGVGGRYLTVSIPVSPLLKSSRALFKHGIEHNVQGSDFDRTVALIHVHNAVELFLKYHAAKRGLHFQRKQIPELVNALKEIYPTLESLAGDLNTMHYLRNSAYHFGQAPDTYTCNWLIELSKSLFSLNLSNENTEGQSR